MGNVPYKMSIKHSRINKMTASRLIQVLQRDPYVLLWSVCNTSLHHPGMNWLKSHSSLKTGAQLVRDTGEQLRSVCRHMNPPPPSQPHKKHTERNHCASLGLYANTAHVDSYLWMTPSVHTLSPAVQVIFPGFCPSFSLLSTQMD